MAKGSTFSLPTESNICSGTIITYEQQSQVMLAVVLNANGKKYGVLNEKGGELDLPLDRIYTLPATLPKEVTTKSSQTEYLAKLHEDANAEADNLSLEDIWSFISTESKEYSIKDLTDLYYGDNALLHHLAIRISLLRDTVFFKRKKDSFVPRPEEIVSELKRAEEARIRKQHHQEETISAFLSFFNKPDSVLPESVENDVQLLKNLAASTDDMELGRTNEAKQFLANCLEKLKLDFQGTKEEQAFKLLKKLSVFDKNTNLSLIRYSVREIFSDEEIAEATNFKHPPFSEFPDKEIRKDLRDLYTVTIDDANTQDMDDALSIEKVPNGYVLGVHISDVASILPIDSLLDKEACRRSTSFYFPTGAIPMLPYELSHQSCSLVAGEDRPCISCLFELDNNFEVKSSQVVASIINVKRKFSYEEVDDLLDNGDEFMNLIYQATVTNETKRFSNGGYKVSKKDMYVVLLPDGSVELKEFDENDPSRAMVGETAIMANETMAGFARDNNFVVAYRCQAAPDDDQIVNVDAIPEGPARDYALRSQLKPSLLSYEPMPHHMLGVDKYIQATSPIRRYVDLCNQRQILNFLRTGQPLYSKDEFPLVIANSENSRSTAMAVTKESRRFWFLRYLQQRAKNDPFIKATVLRCDRKMPLLELDEVFMPVIIRINRQLAQGDVLNLKIVRVDPQFDDLKLEEIN